MNQKMELDKPTRFWQAIYWWLIGFSTFQSRLYSRLFPQELGLESPRAATSLGPAFWQATHPTSGPNGSEKTTSNSVAAAWRLQLF
jgi:hypothetical protein